MSIDEFLAWIKASPVASCVQDSAWLFPVIETAHVLALVFVIASIAAVDLRLLNLAHRHRSVTNLAAEVLPWTWVGFAGAVITGALLFSSDAPKYWANNFFRIKLLLLLLAGVNMLLFHAMTYRSVRQWDRTARTPFGAQLAGGLSLLTWVAIVACGRWIGFT